MNVGAKTVLASSPLFQSVDGEALSALADTAFNRTYAPGEIVFRQGDPGQELYGVVSGRILISVASPDGREVNLNVMSPGDVLGEIALLDGQPRTATGSAMEPTVVCVITKSVFEDFLDQHPKIARQLLVLLCSRVRWANYLMEDAAFYSTPTRLAKRLEGLSSANGGVVRTSQNDLAHFLNVSRQVVNGYLREWQSSGYVSLRRGAVIVHDLSPLTDVRLAPTDPD